MTILAILQELPKHPTRIIRTDSFAKFQALCGMIEQDSYLAAHAACHATMNGTSRTLALDTDIRNEDDLKAKIHAIFSAGPFDALVIPGLTDFDLQKMVCAECLNLVDPGNFKLYLDPLKTDSAEDIIEKQKMLPRFAVFAWPWVPTLTPGRRSMELLPPTCLIASLSLGTATYLKGVHDVESVSCPDDEYLDENGVEVMCLQKNGRRTVIGRYRKAESKEPVREDFNQFVEIPGLKIIDPNGPEPKEVNEAAIENSIRMQLDIKCAEVIKQHGKNDRDLWRALQRTVTSVLNEAKQRGHIVKFYARCDEETASWGTDTVPVVEIVIEYPKRVKGIRFYFEDIQ